MDISTHIEPLQAWFNKLEKRERHTLLAGAAVVLISIFYLAVWDPVFSTLQSEKQRYQSQRQLLSWMKDAGAEIGMLQSSGASMASRFSNQSLPSLVERSAITSGVKPFIKKQESDTRSVKVQLENADFDRLVIWIHDMQDKYAIQASKIHIEPQQAPGAVNVGITLERSGS
jgi:general secretion pathway protein M